MSWKLKQIKQVVRSSLAAETLAMIDGVETALYVNLLLKEFWSAEHVIPIHCITNNKLLYDQLKIPSVLWVMDTTKCDQHSGVKIRFGKKNSTINAFFVICYHCIDWLSVCLVNN